MIAITFIFFLVYLVAKIIQNKKTQYGVEVIFNLINLAEKRSSDAFP